MTSTESQDSPFPVAAEIPELPQDDLEQEYHVPAPPPAPPIPTFELDGAESLTFAVLEAGRSDVYSSREALRSFQAQVDQLATDGEPGRRKGLGLWMLGKFKEAVDQLANYDGDDVADFTRARALVTLRRSSEAEPLFARLSTAYPDEPKPRCGALEATLELAIAKGDAHAAADALEQSLAAAPESFKATAELDYLNGRVAELRRDWQTALDGYGAAREKAPHMRSNLFRMAHLAERCGLDDDALDIYRELVALRPADARALSNLGLLLEDQDYAHEAAACYDLIVRAFPTDVRARLYLRDAAAAMDMYYDEELERKEDRLNQILRIPITDFELSVRARNCLNKMQITTLGDLVCRTEQELLSYKNFGETSLNEIKEILRSKGLRLGMPREEAVASIETAARHTYSGENSERLNKPLHELQLSIRARRTVESLGCLSLGDIVKHSPDELLGMPNFGVTSLQELRAKLTEHGLKLRGED